MLPISDKYMDYANKVLDELNAAGVRAEVDSRAEKIGYKIREAQMQKIPYMLVVGEKEQEADLVSVRSRLQEMKDRRIWNIYCRYSERDC